MQHLDQRKEDILGFIVRDFIGTAFPVSSSRVSTGLNKGSPATVRNIMLELDERGYLCQPHTSAGRAPTEKGYRYFIEHLMSVRAPETEIRERLDKIIESMEREEDSAFEELSKVMAGHLKLFSGIGFLEKDRFFGHGLPEVLREPEFGERGMAAQFADFAENICGNIKKFSGREVEIKGFGVVSVEFRDGDLGECVIFSAGPQRMNYEKAVSVVRYAAEDIKSKQKKNARR